MWRYWMGYVYSHHNDTLQSADETVYVAGGTTCVSGTVCTVLNDCETRSVNFPVGSSRLTLSRLLAVHPWCLSTAIHCSARPWTIPDL